MSESTSKAAMPSGITLREANASDIAEIIEVVNTAFAVERFFANQPRTHRAQLESHFQSGRFLLAHRGSLLLASVYYEVRGERGYIGMLAVRPGHQHCGLGRAMMQAAERILHGSECSIAEITVISVRTALPPLYRKFGYREAGVEEPHEELRQKLTMPVQLIRMEKRLSAEQIDSF